MRELNRLCSILILLSLVSCSKAAKIEYFFIRENVGQYFLRPAGLESDGSDMAMDFTFRTGDTTDVICNYTIESDFKSKSTLDSVYFEIEGKEVVPVRGKQVLIKELHNNKLRFSSTIKQDDFKKLLNSKEMQFICIWGSYKEMFEPSSQFLKTLQEAKLNFQY